jgi:ubiquinone/menaquinone biosynthesis C-methylase UbiE
LSERFPQDFEQSFEQSSDLYQKIIAGNLEVHIKDAPLYDIFHGELFNWYEQSRINRDLDTILQFSGGRKVLDVGCGTGNLTMKFVAQNCETTAIDLSQPMLEKLAEKLRRQDAKANIVCENIDTYLERWTGKYDMITLSSVLHHLPNYYATLENLTRFFNPGGVLYITHEPSGIDAPSNPVREKLYSLDSLLWRYISGAWRYRRPKIDWQYSDYHAHHGFNGQGVLGFLEERGFKIIKHAFYSATMRLGINNAIDHLIFRPKTHFSVIAVWQTA